MSAIVSALSISAGHIPELARIGQNVAPIIVETRDALNAITEPEVVNSPEYKALDELIAGYERQYAGPVEWRRNNR